jgi:hypothetical protein
MKVFRDNDFISLTDAEILSIATNLPTEVAGLIRDLLRRASRAEHQCDVWRKLAIETQQKLEQQTNDESA